MAKRARTELVSSPPSRPAKVEAAAAVEPDLDAQRAAKRQRLIDAAIARAPSSFAVVSHLYAGRTLEAGEMRFPPGRKTVVSLDDVGAARYAAIITAGYLVVSYIDRAEYEALQRSGEATPAAPVPDPKEARIEALTRECARLREDLAAAHREIALLTGRRTGGQGPVADHRDDGSPPV